MRLRPRNPTVDVLPAPLSKPAGLSRDETVVIQRQMIRLQIGTCVSFSDLAQRVAALAGKPITISACGDDTWDNVTAILSRSLDHIAVLVRASDSAVYQLHGVLHEFGHILLDHQGCLADGEAAHAGRGELLAEAIAFELAQFMFSVPNHNDARVFG